MKSLNIIVTFALVTIFFPAHSQANIEARVESETRIQMPFENGIDLRKLDLQNKLFKEKIEEHRADFQKAKEAFKNSSSDTRNMMRAEFRAKFHERFKFTYDKLSEFQTRMTTRINTEKELGVDVSKAEAKLNTSISFMAQIEANVEKLKVLLSERYAEDERDTKKEEARTLVEAIKADTKSSHIALKEAFMDLRSAKSAEIKTNTSAQIDLTN